MQLSRSLSEKGHLDVILPSIHHIKEPILNSECGVQCIENTSSKNRKQRVCALEAILSLGENKVEIVENIGPLVLAYVKLNNPDNPTESRKIAVIAQNNDGERETRHGALYPEEHTKALEFLNYIDSQGIPLLSITDTPGAKADEKANLNLQSRSISWLISRCTELGVPHLNFNLGEGGSGGAIALFGHLSYMAQESWFNTIVPVAAQKIQREGLSLQECIKLAGLDPISLMKSGIKNGVVALQGRQEELQSGEFGKKFGIFIWYGLQEIEKSIQVKTEELEGQIASLSASQRKELLSILSNFQKEGGTPASADVPSAYQAGRQRREKFEDPLVEKLEGTPILLKRYATYLLMQSKLDRLLSFSTVEEFQKKNHIQEVSNNQTLKIPETKNTFEVLHQWQEFVTKLSVTELSRESRQYLRKYQGLSETGDRTWTQTLANKLGQYFNRGEGAEIANEIVDALIFQSIQFFGDQAANLLDALATKTKLEEVIQDFPETDDSKLVYWLRHFSQRFEKKLPAWLLCNQMVENTNVNKQGREIVLEGDKIKNIADIVAIVGKLLGSEKKDFCQWLQKSEKHRIALWQLLQNRFKYSGKPNCFPPLFYYGFRKQADPNLDLNQVLQECRVYGGAEGIHRFWLTFEDLVRTNQIREKIKQTSKISPEVILKLPFFKEGSFTETHSNLICANSNQYPGLNQVIKKSIETGDTPSSIITGEIIITLNKKNQKIKIVLSNPSFQAGSIDMAAGEKIKRTLIEASETDTPIVMFLNTGGMNVKEGAQSLMSMAVMNQAVISYYYKTNRKPLLFGYGNLMGGTDASLFNSPYVDNYLLENTNQLFAGQEVVPEYLPLSCRMSNLTSVNSEKMQGLVVNTFIEKIRKYLQYLLPEALWAELTLEDVLGEKIFNFQIEKKKHREHLNENREKYNFQKVAIINRGEIAVDSMQTLIKMKKKGVLLCSTADLNAYATRFAQENGFEVICLGGDQSNESYLNIENILAALRLNKVDAVMVGYGFLSENKLFAEKCLASQIVPIMPPPAILAKFGDKEKARQVAIEAEVPVVPGSPHFSNFSTETQKTASQIGYPLIVKAILGGGGKGMRIIEKESDLEKLCKEASREAQASFGNGNFYLEKYLPSVRHIEAQVVRDRFGNSQVLDLRDCSLQRNHQKIIEETAVLSDEVKTQIYTYAEKLLDFSGYTGIGTIEFLYNPATEEVYFMEVNPRIQVERKVSELRFQNIDLLKTQIQIAQGEKIQKEKLKNKVGVNHTMQVRINAVNPKDNFTASPGRITQLDLSALKDISGLVIQQSVEEGDQVTSFYDSNILLLIAEGSSREIVIEKLRTALEKISLEGIYTNLEFIKACLNNNIFLTNQHDTHFIDKQGKSFLKNLPDQKIPPKSEFAIELEPGQEFVLATIPGVFMRGISALPFVTEGDIVTENTQIAYTEAMKMQTTIVWPGPGKAKVIEVIATNGKSVQPGEPLFIIEPIVEKN